MQQIPTLTRGCRVAELLQIPQSHPDGSAITPIREGGGVAEIPHPQLVMQGDGVATNRPRRVEIRYRLRRWSQWGPVPPSAGETPIPKYIKTSGGSWQWRSGDQSEI